MTWTLTGPLVDDFVAIANPLTRNALPFEYLMSLCRLYVRTLTLGHQQTVELSPGG